jgi:hypothetical protein
VVVAHSPPTQLHNSTSNHPLSPPPIGLHFAWLLNDVNWWDKDWCLPRGKRGPLFWRSGALLETFVQKEVRNDSQP